MKTSKQWKYFVGTYNPVTYSQDYYIDGAKTSQDGFPLCNDIAVSMYFNSTEEAHRFAEEQEISPDDYFVHGFYVEEIEWQ